MSYLVKDYMDKDVPTVDGSTSVTEAAQRISKTGKGFLIVLEEGKPQGIVTEKDFVEKIVAKELDPAKILIKKIMSSPLITVDPDENLLKASEIMQKHDIRRIPVTKDNIIYGVITASKIAQRCGEYVDQSLRDIMKWALPISL